MKLSRDENGLPIVGVAKLGATQVITVGSTSVSSTGAVGTDTKFVRLATTKDCHVAFGSSPTATTADVLLPAGHVGIYPITPSEKIAAIYVTSTGTLTMTELGK